MFRIKKIDIFVARQFGLLFIGTFFICQFVLMMQFLWQYIDTLIGKGLSMEIMAQFFWYMGLMLVPQALPLAILLSSLITFGNLGESSELTAIKAAGISLMQTFRPLIFITILISIGSFFFQNNIGPDSNMKISQLLTSMKQKSPEVEIPEGIFYDGIPNCNLYVQKKDVKSGMLYGIMIYRMTASFEDAAIILADSGMLQSTADKKHLSLKLWSGEWFENMKSQDLANSVSVPYRRESFIEKHLILDFDADFNMTDASLFANNARGKSLKRIKKDIDSLNHEYDSIGKVFFSDAKKAYFNREGLSKTISNQAHVDAGNNHVNFDSAFAQLPTERKSLAINMARTDVQTHINNLKFKSLITKEGDKVIRLHKIEVINKFMLALSCLLFFFIGAPLGAIIRKGGLGFPVLISVIVFIFYYILDNSGYRMARQGIWAIWFGKTLSTAILAPIAVFVTYKANQDSVVFNPDAYRSFFMSLLGMRDKRRISSKEVIIENPRYEEDAHILQQLNADIAVYSQKHRLHKAPRWMRVFFYYEDDREIEHLCEKLENVINDLSNTRDKVILHHINAYPIVSARAHTRPFNRRWLNISAAILFPIGLVLYIRMWVFRIRLARDLRSITHINNIIIEHIGKKIKTNKT